MREALSLAMVSCTLRNQFTIGLDWPLIRIWNKNYLMISGDIPDSCQSTSGVVVESIPSHLMSSTTGIILTFEYYEITCVLQRSI